MVSLPGSALGGPAHPLCCCALSVVVPRSDVQHRYASFPTSFSVAVKFIFKMFPMKVYIQVTSIR